MKRTVLTLVASVLFIVLLLLGTAGYAGDIKSYSDWIKIDETLKPSWNIIPDRGNSLKLSLEPKFTSPQYEGTKILFLFPKKSSAYDTAINKILHIFVEKGVSAHILVINYKGDSTLGEKALEQAQNQKANLIFSMGSKTTAFLHKHFKNGPIPVLSVCSKDPVLMGQMKDYENGSGSNLAYTSLNISIETQMAYFKMLMKDLKTIGIMYAVNNKSAVITQVEPLRKAAQNVGIEIIDIAVEDQANAKLELREKIPQAIKEMELHDAQLKQSIFWITGSTSVFRELETINQHAQKIPVLSVVPNIVKEGHNSALLSIGVSFDSNAHLAALYGLNILSGKKAAGEIAVGVVESPDISINFMKAREIGFKIPFSFFESASFLYDHQGKIIRKNGQKVVQ